MNQTIEFLLLRLESQFNAALDRIHGEAILKFRILARSTGQRTRTDRKPK